MANINKVNQLKAQLRKAKSDLEVTKAEVQLYQKNLSSKQQHVNYLEEEIKKYSETKSIKVSEHAILRYLERIGGLDIKVIENAILSQSLLNEIDKSKSQERFQVDGMTVVIKDNIVVTII